MAGLVFFFKQKTAYEISACLVGSEMCIRDRRGTALHALFLGATVTATHTAGVYALCLLYTSDAADERSSVDLGGRRFFYKQKTAYEISACLVGSEMCIRDRRGTALHALFLGATVTATHTAGVYALCLLYTSDAADERSSVDLGGRRIIK